MILREWNVEAGEIAPMLSLKRKVIMEKHKDAVKRSKANSSGFQGISLEVFINTGQFTAAQVNPRKFVALLSHQQESF